MNSMISSHSFPTGRIEIWPDEDAESPRDWDNLGTMTCWHRRYILGDKHKFDDSQELFFHLARQIHPEFPHADDVEWSEGTWQDRLQQIIDKHYAVLPLYLMDHSGISMSTGAFSCPWDSGQVGFIWMGLEKAQEIGGCAGKGWLDPVEFEHTDRFTLRSITRTVTGTVRERAEQWMRGEVETYDSYLRGNVCGFRAFAVDPVTGEEEEADSCWGFYSEEDALAEGKCQLPHAGPNREFDLAEAALA